MNRRDLGTKPALQKIRDQLNLDYAETLFLDRLTRLFGLERPFIGFAQDDLWRAIVRSLAMQRRSNLAAFGKVLDLVIGPRLTRLSTLYRATEAPPPGGQPDGSFSAFLDPLEDAPAFGDEVFLDPAGPNSEKFPYLFLERSTRELQLDALHGTQIAHPKWIPYRGGTLAEDARAGTVSVTVVTGTISRMGVVDGEVDFPAVGDTLRFDAGVPGAPFSRTITAVGHDWLRFDLAAIAGPYPVTPVAYHLLNASFSGRYGIGSIVSGNVLRDTATAFDTRVATFTANRGYAVIVNRGGTTEERLTVIKTDTPTGLVTFGRTDTSGRATAGMGLRYRHRIGESIEVADLPASSTLSVAAVPGTGTLVLVNSSWLPLANFSVLVDRGLTTEERLWATANNGTGNLTLLNVTVQNHAIGAAIRAAQVLIPPCTWEIWETVPHKVIVEIPNDCVPVRSTRGNTYLHPSADLVAVTKTALITGSTSAGSKRLKLLYDPGAPSGFYDAIVNGTTNVRNPMRTAIVSASTSTEEKVMLTSIVEQTRLVSYLPAGATVLSVEDASNLAVGACWVGLQSQSFVAVDKNLNTATLAAGLPLGVREGTYVTMNAINVRMAYPTRFAHSSNQIVQLTYPLYATTALLDGNPLYTTSGQTNRYPGRYLTNLVADMPRSVATTLYTPAVPSLTTSVKAVVNRVPPIVELLAEAVGGAVTITPARANEFPLSASVPSQLPFRVIVSKGHVEQEVATVTANNGTTFTVNPLKQAHLINRPVQLLVDAIQVQSGAGFPLDGGYVWLGFGSKFQELRKYSRREQGALLIFEPAVLFSFQHGLGTLTPVRLGAHLASFSQSGSDFAPYFSSGVLSMLVGKHGIFQVLKAAGVTVDATQVS